ncbi:cell wall-binding repeat-containing protein [Peptostreptococcus sp.]|uniref:cell wall-binding repeat-containing protein n=1 Tax=Peptostreptococcus sp. TaxID=1262 RepID=UPI0039947572
MLNKKYNISKKMASVALSLIMTTGTLVPGFAEINHVESRANLGILQNGKEESEIKAKLRKLVEGIISDKSIRDRYVGTIFIKTVDNGTPFDVFSDGSKMNEAAIQDTPWWKLWQEAYRINGKLENLTDAQAKSLYDDLMLEKTALCFPLSNELRRDGYYEGKEADFDIYKVTSVNSYTPAQDIYTKGENNTEIKKLFGIVAVVKSGNEHDIMLSMNKNMVKSIKHISFNGIATVKPITAIRPVEQDSDIAMFSVTVPGEVGPENLVVNSLKYINNNNEEVTISEPFGIDIKYSQLKKVNTSLKDKRPEGYVENKIQAWMKRGDAIKREIMDLTETRKIDDALREIRDFRDMGEEDLTRLYEIVKPIYYAEYKETTRGILTKKLGQQKSSLDSSIYSPEIYTKESLENFKSELERISRSMDNKDLSDLVGDVARVTNLSFTVLRYNTEKLQGLYDKVKDRVDKRGSYESDSYAKFLVAFTRAEKWLETTKNTMPVPNDTKEIYDELKNAANSLKRKDGNSNDLIEDDKNKGQENDAIYDIKVNLQKPNGHENTDFSKFISKDAKYIVKEGGKSKKLVLYLKPIMSDNKIDKLITEFQYSRKNILQPANTITRKKYQVDFVDGSKALYSPEKIELDVDGKQDLLPIDITYCDSKEKVDGKRYITDNKLSINYDEKVKTDNENLKPDNGAGNKEEPNIPGKNESKDYTVNVKFLHEDGHSETHAAPALINRAKLSINGSDKILTLKLRPLYGEGGNPTGVISKIYYFEGNQKSGKKFEAKNKTTARIRMKYESVDKEYEYPTQVEIPVDGSTRQLYLGLDSATPVFGDKTHAHTVVLDIDYAKKTDGYNDNEVDKTQLINLINSINKDYYQVYKNIIPVKPYENLMSAYNNAILVSNNINSTKDEVSEAYINLFNSLIKPNLYIEFDIVKRQADADLKSDSESGKYTQESVKEAKKFVEDSYKELKEYLVRDDIQDSKIDDYKFELQHSPDRLRYDTSELEKVISEAEVKSNSDKYTDETLEYLKDKLSEAKSYLKETKSKRGQDKRSELIKEIDNAIKSLIEKTKKVSSQARKSLESKVSIAKKIEQGKKSKLAYDELNKVINESVNILNVSGNDDDYEKQIEKLEKAIEKFKASEDIKIDNADKNKEEDKNKEKDKNKEEDKNKEKDKNKEEDKNKEKDKNEDKDKNKEKDNDNSVKKNIDAKIMDENNRESMADIFLKDHKVVTKYDKDKDQTTYELTFKRYDVDKPSVGKLYVKNGEDFKEANLANEDKGVNTFKFIRKGEPEKSIIIKMYIPAMNAEKTAKLTLDVKNEIAKSEITSLEGENRYDTACKISKKLYPKTNKRAVLASGQVTVDALSTSLFASKKGAPILLTKSSYLPSETIRELKRLGVSEVSIIGGYNTINRQVTDELRAMGISTERIYGSDRYDTAIELAKKTGSDLKKLVIVNGVNYADAISISGYCAQNDYNMILTNGKSLSDGDMSLIKKSDEVIIVGGDKSISNDLERKIDMIAKKTRRISGYDRYETSLKLSEELYTKTDEILMAAGDNDKMTDALAGSQLAAYKKAPLQLVSNYMTSRQKKYIEDKKISNATILGGINSIGRSMRESIKSLIVKD